MNDKESAYSLKSVRVNSSEWRVMVGIGFKSSEGKAPNRGEIKMYKVRKIEGEIEIE